MGEGWVEGLPGRHTRQYWKALYTQTTIRAPIFRIMSSNDHRKSVLKTLIQAYINVSDFVSRRALTPSLSQRARGRKSRGFVGGIVSL
jgi:hypothetical protein